MLILQKSNSTIYYTSFIFLYLQIFRTMTLAKHTVFVYGTLKQGEPNHNWFSKHEGAYYKFICNAQTEEKYPLIIGTKYNIPFLLYSPGK